MSFCQCVRCITLWTFSWYTRRLCFLSLGTNTLTLVPTNASMYILRSLWNIGFSKHMNEKTHMIEVAWGLQSEFKMHRTFHCGIWMQHREKNAETLRETQREVSMRSNLILVFFQNFYCFIRSIEIERNSIGFNLLFQRRAYWKFFYRILIP